MSASVAQIKNSSVVTKTTIVIDSKFRTTGEINNFTFDIGTTIEDVKLVEVISADFVNILSNVDTTNNKLNWVDSLGVTHFDEVAVGNYTILTLMSAIGETMNGSTTDDGIYIATADFNTGQITIENDDLVAFDLLFGTSANESIGPILGFGATNFFGIISEQSDEILSLYPTKHIYIGSTALTDGATDLIRMSNGISSIAYIVNVDGIYGDILHQDETRSIKLDIAGIKVIDLKLYDDNGIDLVIPAAVNEDKGTFTIILDIYAGIFDFTYYD